MTVLQRLDATDRMLFLRWALVGTTSRPRRVLWRTLTQLGGASFTVAAALLPLMLGGNAARGGRLAIAVLVVSHLFVQLVKRTATRPRPSRRLVIDALIAEPDRFSFPSGHAAAAMSIAIGYAIAWPVAGPLLLSLALLVGVSRVVLGVHYPGDVLVGQLIALGTGALMVLV